MSLTKEKNSYKTPLTYIPLIPVTAFAVLSALQRWEQMRGIPFYSALTIGVLAAAGIFYLFFRSRFLFHRSFPVFSATVVFISATFISDYPVIITSALLLAGILFFTLDKFKSALIFVLTVFVLTALESLFRRTIPLQKIYLLIIFAVLLTMILSLKLFLKDKDARIEKLQNELSTVERGMRHIGSSDYSRQSGKKEKAKTLQEKLDTVIDLVKTTFGALTAVYFDYSQKDRKLRIQAASTESEYFNMDAALRSGEGPVGLTASRKTPLLISNSDSPLENPGYYKPAPDIHSFLGIPVIDHHTLKGVLVIDHPESEAFIESDRENLKMFGSYISETIEIQKMIDGLENESKELKTLYKSVKDISTYIEIEELKSRIWELLREIISFDYGFLITKNQPGSLPGIESSHGITPDSKTLTENCWCSWMIDQDKHFPLSLDQSDKSKEMPYVFPEEPQTKNFLGLPLRIRDRSTGVIALLEDSSEGFGGRKIKPASVLADHIAVILQNAKMYSNMVERANTDGLTGLYNHRTFQEKLEAELKRTDRTGSPLSLVILDIDNFKQFNDTYGHQTGDYILKNLADILISEIREIDIAARYGGEEFSVILVDTGSEESVKTAQRLRKKIAGSKFNYENKTLNITASFGISTYPAFCEDKSTLIKQADRALYSSKEAGRNRTRHWRNL